MKLRYRARALADLEDIQRYLEERSPGGARNVLQAIHASIQSIVQQPYGFPRTDDPKIRVKAVRRYRYKIFYSVIEDVTIEIMHVRHTARRPWEAT